MPVDRETTESGSFDAFAVAQAVAADLKVLYGARLRRVILFGSFARGEGDPEGSDIDLMVVLDEVESPFEETYRMDEILWRHSFENDTVVSALAIGEADIEHPVKGVVVNALREGRRVA